MQDGVPKAIMHFMVNNTKRGLQRHLIQELYRCVRVRVCVLPGGERALFWVELHVSFLGCREGRC